MTTKLKFALPMFVAVLAMASIADAAIPVEAVVAEAPHGAAKDAAKEEASIDRDDLAVSGHFDHRIDRSKLKISREAKSDKEGHEPPDLPDADSKGSPTSLPAGIIFNLAIAAGLMLATLIAAYRFVRRRT